MILTRLNFTNHSPLGVQFDRISVVRFLPAVFQATTLVILQQAVLATVMSIAKSAVANDALRRSSTLLEITTNLLLRRATS